MIILIFMWGQQRVISSQSHDKMNGQNINHGHQWQFSLYIFALRNSSSFYHKQIQKRFARKWKPTGFCWCCCCISSFLTTVTENSKKKIIFIFTINLFFFYNFMENCAKAFAWPFAAWHPVKVFLKHFCCCCLFSLLLSLCRLVGVRRKQAYRK